jgi:hypothetical protein
MGALVSSAAHCCSPFCHHGSGGRDQVQVAPADSPRCGGNCLSVHCCFCCNGPSHPTPALASTATSYFLCFQHSCSMDDENQKEVREATREKTLLGPNIAAPGGSTEHLPAAQSELKSAYIAGRGGVARVSVPIMGPFMQMRNPTCTNPSRPSCKCRHVFAYIIAQSSVK